MKQQIQIDSLLLLLVGTAPIATRAQPAVAGAEEPGGPSYEHTRQTPPPPPPNSK